MLLVQKTDRYAVFMHNWVNFHKHSTSQLSNASLYYAAYILLRRLLKSTATWRDELNSHEQAESVQIMNNSECVSRSILQRHMLIHTAEKHTNALNATNFSHEQSTESHADLGKKPATKLWMPQEVCTIEHVKVNGQDELTVADTKSFHGHVATGYTMWKK